MIPISVSLFHLMFFFFLLFMPGTHTHLAFRELDGFFLGMVL
jgi:hypothetical protein